MTPPKKRMTTDAVFWIASIAGANHVNGLDYVGG